ncbi:bifunctional 2-polyprenyl-6-hydroxyphenol methylase/3-demethylubiquinol 3-O-methyltransferase UbiG [Herbiconiux sp. L3-i23]|uniref:class I SAM-dependent methyltransferase n=1 Tax=Herbiconiux sp. L3-i23 TaxID=2905871 RepID=UPI00206A8414|nr:class I SAM-dependent methyltransferase [Herbiconiux sp. L3-i23]BDI24070.1 methyltransferase [Herbiconiux sp. L3-i23]
MDSQWDDTYQQTNRANWDDRAVLHSASDDSGYRVGRFADDPSLLSDVVRFDRGRLGDIRGARTVHLQCHIGTDTLSLARLGADVVGLDFSGEAVQAARALVSRTGDPVEFVQSDVYAATDLLEPGSFDLVYTGVGALCWLPDIDRWAQTVAALLKPGGRLFIREGHPVLWALDDSRSDVLAFGYPYFEREEPLIFDGDESYVETDRPLTATKTYEWNHGIGEIVTALLRHGMRLTMLIEHDTVPWLALPGQMVEREEFDEFALIPERPSIPLTYTLQAVKG